MKEPSINYTAAWRLVFNAQKHGPDEANLANRESFESRAIKAALGPYKLACFLHRLRCRYSDVRQEMTDLEAAQLYLLNKHNWTCGKVLAIKEVHLSTLLQEELLKFRLSQDELAPVRSAAEGLQCWPDLLQELPCDTTP
ncbi:hypothetical protein PSCICE_02570 [Pseudomonas cichorii]|nr:hypothetical protein PSCICE_02570 [Pseudomonas cichorii]